MRAMQASKGSLISRILTPGQCERLAAAIRSDPTLTHKAVGEALGVSAAAVRVWWRERGGERLPGGGRLPASERQIEIHARHRRAVAYTRQLMREAREA